MTKVTFRHYRTNAVVEVIGEPDENLNDLNTSFYFIKNEDTGYIESIKRDSIMTIERGEWE